VICGPAVSANQKKSRSERLGVVGRSSFAPTLPAPSLSFADQHLTSGGSWRPSAIGPSEEHAIARVEFYQDVVDVNFDGARFNGRFLRLIQNAPPSTLANR
jgi:hypothetical protein